VGLTGLAGIQPLSTGIYTLVTLGLSANAANAWAFNTVALSWTQLASLTAASGTYSRPSHVLIQNYL
jgi:hypothetical protein